MTYLSLSCRTLTSWKRSGWKNCMWRKSAGMEISRCVYTAPISIIYIFPRSVLFRTIYFYQNVPKQNSMSVGWSVSVFHNFLKKRQEFHTPMIWAFDCNLKNFFLFRQVKWAHDNQRWETKAAQSTTPELIGDVILRQNGQEESIDVGSLLKQGYIFWPFPPPFPCFTYNSEDSRQNLLMKYRKKDLLNKSFAELHGMILMKFL